MGVCGQKRGGTVGDSEGRGDRWGAAGEKVAETLVGDGEAVGPTKHPKILRLQGRVDDAATLGDALTNLLALVSSGAAAEAIKAALMGLANGHVPEDYKASRGDQSIGDPPVRASEGRRVAASEAEAADGEDKPVQPMESGASANGLREVDER